jgi:hypothetical protein
MSHFFLRKQQELNHLSYEEVIEPIKTLTWTNEKAGFTYITLLEHEEPYQLIETPNS